jgi:8-oxo-dGTP pyrophosphatase MutT (NUDIX family)
MAEAQRTATVRDAATVIVVRDGAARPEVLLLRRSARSGFAADAWVFPGGVVDGADAALPPTRWRGIDPAALAPRFGREADVVLGLHVAALRETFEEAGLLLAGHGDGRPPGGAPAGAAELRAALVARRAGARDFAAWLAARGLVLELGALAYWARWITPRSEGRRYDTAFFATRAPPGQEVAHDRVEVTDQRWLAPADALASQARGELHLILPTREALTELATLDSADAVLAHARARAAVPAILPHVERRGSTVRFVLPREADYPHAAYADELARRTVVPRDRAP